MPAKQFEGTHSAFWSGIWSVIRLVEHSCPSCTKVSGCCSEMILEFVVCMLARIIHLSSVSLKKLEQRV